MFHRRKMRQERLAKEWWRYGLDLPAEAKQNLSNGELAYLQAYDKLMTDYISDLGLDLRTV